MELLRKRICIMFFFSASLLFADEGKLILSLEDAVKTALENNAGIRQSEISLNAKKRAESYSWNSISPSVSGIGRYSKDVPGESDSEASVSAGVSLTASLSPSVYTSVKGAGLEYAQQQLSYQNDIRTLELDVRKKYYSLLYKSEEIALKEKSVSTSKAQYESNLAKYNRGTFSKLDVLSAQVSYQNDQLELKSLKTAMENETASFKQLVGIPQGTEIQLSGSFEAVMKFGGVSLDGIEIAPYSVESIQNKIESAKNSLLASRFAAYGPSLSASYSYNYSSADSGSTWDDKGTLSLQASIPIDGIFPWSKGAQDVAAQKDSLRTLELELEDARISLDVNIAVLMNQIKQCLENLELRKSSIELAQTTYNMTLESYNHGTKDLLSLQNSSDELLSARLNLLLETYNLICSILDLENIIGVPFGTLEK
ncbi:TolC family protein [Treponema sp.]|uniref:TolC family protein n=1 Tax=Treponema sp. TaxID=166 RepID=UPI003F0866F8